MTQASDCYKAISASIHRDRASNRHRSRDGQRRDLGQPVGGRSNYCR